MAEIYQVNSFSSYRLKTSVSSSLMLFLMLSFRVVVCTELPCSLCVLMSIKALFHCNVAIYFYLTIFPTGLLSFLRNEGTNMSFFPSTQQILNIYINVSHMNSSGSLLHQQIKLFGFVSPCRNGLILHVQSSSNH